MIYKRRKSIYAAVLALVISFIFCGCTDISGRELTYVYRPAETTEPPEGVGGDLLVITTFGAEDETEPPEINIEGLEDFTPQQQEFINSCLFMGDSICLGFGVYGLVNNCTAKAGAAARNIEEFTFDSGGSQVSPYTAIVNSNCKNLVFLMGINDVNMENAKDYIEYYNSFLTRVEALAAGTNIYILSVTPVTASSTFCYNYQIDEFNEALRTMTETSSRRYVDVSTALKDELGNLRTEYASDNSVHLTKEAYYQILAALCREVGA